MADITMPKMGFDMTEGTIVRWLKKVGDFVNKGEAVAEIERQAAINEDILRWMTIKVDELEKGPSVMMRKQERRGGRGGRDRDGEE